MSKKYVTMATGRDSEGGRGSVTVPRYIYDEACQMFGGHHVRQMVRDLGKGAKSYDAARMLFQAVLTAARQGNLPGVE